MTINFSGIRRESMVGSLLRAPLRLLPDDTVVPVVQGPLKGKRWISGSGNHGCWLGTYELSKQLAMREHIRPGMVCYDVGANVGFYTLLFSHLAGTGGNVLAFEPFPRNVALLRRHTELNHCDNVTIFDAAVADYDGTAQFEEAPNASMGHLSDQGGITVDCRRLDTLVREGFAAPDLIKIDVEGAEAGVLAGAVEILQKHKPVIFLATHGPKPHQDCLALLREHGYSVSGATGEAVDETDELVAVATAPVGVHG
jgi:FkbM family methyltransferase